MRGARGGRSQSSGERGGKRVRRDQGSGRKKKTTEQRRKSRSACLTRRARAKSDARARLPRAIWNGRATPPPRRRVAGRGCDAHLVVDLFPFDGDVELVQVGDPGAPRRVDEAVADVAHGRAGHAEERGEVVEEELAERLHLTGACARVGERRTDGRQRDSVGSRSRRSSRGRGNRAAGRGGARARRPRGVSAGHRESSSDLVFRARQTKSRTHRSRAGPSCSTPTTHLPASRTGRAGAGPAGR